jgi:serine/threonine-protein kinase
MSPPARIGRYRIIRQIGRGGMGIVYLAQLEAAADIRRLVAIKLLHDDGEGARHQAALLDEARLTALLSHPNVVQMLDAGLEEGVAWFAMEFVPGLPLHELARPGGGRLPPWVAARIAADACAAVHAVHQAKDERGNPLEIVHRDVTPQNLLVSWDGIVKLTDLGVARSSLRGSLTGGGGLKGKIGYMAPEQAQGAAVDRRTDVFALGVILWEMLAGRRLFTGATPAEALAKVVRAEAPPIEQVAPGVPAALAEIAARALARSPADRFATALEMQREIEAALASSGLVVGAPEVAQLLARIAPDRVGEHEAWLSAAAPAPAAPPRAARDGSDAITTARPLPNRRRERRAKVITAAVLGCASLAAVVALARLPASGRVGAGGVPSAIATPAPPVVVAPAVPAAAASAAPEPEPPAEPAPAPRSAAAHAPARARARGSLNVSASPSWATIRVDGRTIGPTPTVVTALRPGRHLVEALPASGGPPQRRSVEVAPTQTTKIEFEF